MTITQDYKAVTIGVTEKEAQAYIERAQKHHADSHEPTLRDRHRAVGDQEKADARMGITFHL